MSTFLHWVQVASPGFNADLFTLYAWNSTALFVQALRERGHRPEPGLAPPGAVEDHLVQRWLHRHQQQSGGQDDVELLPGGPRAQRAVDPAGRSSDQQPHPWVSLRLFLRDAPDLLNGAGGNGSG